MSAPPRPTVAVVVVNWNRPGDTAECLRSLAAQTHGGCRAIVVDNGSTDGSVADLSAEFPDVELIANGRNLGFAAGTNVGIRRALELSADYVLLLNNDTVLDPACLEKLLDHAGRSDVLAPAIYRHSPPHRLWSAGAREGVGLPRDLAAGDLVEDVVRVDYVTGCAMLVRGGVFERIGLLDERYFMYYEDSEFCLRARRAGYAIGVVPAARVWHKVGQSLRHDAPAERYLRMRNGLKFYRSELRGWRSILVPVWASVQIGRALWRDGRRGSWRTVGATLHGLRKGLEAS